MVFAHLEFRWNKIWGCRNVNIVVCRYNVMCNEKWLKRIDACNLQLQSFKWTICREVSLKSHEEDLIRIIVRLVLPADVVNISGDWSKWESLRSYQVLKATKLNFPNQITKIPHFNCWWVANGAVMVVHCADCSNVGPVQGNEAPPSHQITHLVGVETNWW